MAYPDIDDLKSHLGIASTVDDTILTNAIDAAVNFVERETSRTFVVSGDSTVYFPPTSKYVKQSYLYLHRDLAQITSVTNGNGDSLSSSDYDTQETSDGVIYALRLYRASVINGNYWRFGSDGTEIAIVGRWGYSVDCPDAIFQAILQIGAHLYRARSAGQGGTITALSRRAGLVVGQAKLPDDVLYVIERFRRHR